MEKVNKSYPSAFSLRSALKSFFPTWHGLANVCVCVCVRVIVCELLCVREGDEQVTYA